MPRRKTVGLLTAALLSLTGQVNFHDAAWTNAVNTFQDWVSKGYIAKDSVGLTATQAGNDFETGKSPVLMSGSRWAGTFETEIKNFSWGTFPVYTRW